MLLLFSSYFSSLNLKYLKLTKMDLTRFAMKLFTYLSYISFSCFHDLFLFDFTYTSSQFHQCITSYNTVEVLETVALQEPEPEAPLCQEVTVPECRQLGFTHTSFPNLFGHTTPAEMAQDMQALSKLVVSQCSDDVLPLICAAYLPKCDPATGLVTEPCKETCRRVFKDCKDSMKELNVGKLDLFACRNYESKKTVGACVEGETDAL